MKKFITFAILSGLLLFSLAAFSPNTEHIVTKIALLYEQNHAQEVSFRTIYPFYTIVYREDAVPDEVKENIRIITRDAFYNTYQLLYSFSEDSSIHRYVARDDLLNDVMYAPENLVSVSQLDNIDIFTYHDELYVDQRIVDDINRLAADYMAQFGENLIINSAYRSYQQQDVLFNAYLERNESLGQIEGDLFEYTAARAALPGSSEHQLGLAIDLRGFSTQNVQSGKWKERYERMQNNAHFYGFTQSYQKGIAIDGYIIEPRHRRYVGTPLAVFLQNHGISFTQFREIMK